ncbi:MAG: alpha/beta hydrolase, partial [Planctomycetota bacterium]|nr:alpha/beta hydrolase [Planctomycetota bacterium]
IFAMAVAVGQSEFDKHKPDVVVGSSRGGAVALNINSGDTPLVLLCPAWKNWGKVTTLKKGSVVLHSRNDEVIPYVNSEELVSKSGLSADTLWVVGNDHRLADDESLAKMLKAIETR